MTDSVYLGNPNLKKANVQQEWTKEELEEYTRCMKDPIYFIQNYIQIVSLDEGLVPFNLYDFHKRKNAALTLSTKYILPKKETQKNCDRLI